MEKGEQFLPFYLNLSKDFSIYFRLQNSKVFTSIFFFIFRINSVELFVHACVRITLNSLN